MNVNATTERRTALTMQAPELDLLAPAEAEEWRRRLEHTARPCGCKTGAVASVTALGATVVWHTAGGLPSGLLQVGLAVLTSFLVVIAAGVAGKLAGIAIGRQHHWLVRWRLARRARALAVEI
jgi:hypothetical protein